MKRIFSHGAVMAALVFTLSGCGGGSKVEVVTSEPKPQLGLQAWTFRQFSLFETIDKAKKLGVTRVQVYFGQAIGGGIDGKVGVELDAAKVAKILEKAKSCGVDLVSCGVVGAPNEEEWKKVFATAKLLGLKDVTVEPPIEMLPLLAKMSAENGMTLSVHNHPKPKSPYWDPAVALAAIKDLPPHVALCADCGHWARSGVDPVKALKQAAGRIHSLHFKDLSERKVKGRDVPWGTGVSDAAGMIAELRRQKFKGIAFIEYEFQSPTLEDEVALCVDFFNRAVAAPLADLEAGKVLPPGYTANVADTWSKGRGDKSAKWPASTPLFDAELSNAEFKPGSWTWSNGVLVAQGGGDIWTKESFGDFAVMLEFKTETNSNSGVFLRCSDTVNWLHNAIEVQIFQGDDENKKHVAGAIFDCAAPANNVTITPGEWNRYVITARGNTIRVDLNGVTVNTVNLDQWTEAGKNPDGSPNKFQKAYKDMARSGRIGLQFHNTPIEFRNLWVERY